LPSGQYRITSSALPAGYSLKSILHENADVLNQPFTAREGSSQLLSISIGVSTSPWLRVAGRVTGGLAEQVSLTNPSLGETLTTNVGPGGVFEFPKLPPGSYIARVLPPPALPTPTGFVLVGKDITDLEVRIPPAKEVTVKISISGAATPQLSFTLAPPGTAPATATATATANGALVSIVGNTTVATSSRPDGTLKVALPAGERKITIVPATLPSGYVVERFTYGTVDLLINSIRVGLNDTSEISITLVPSPATPQQK
jgi:hypothetical protein